MLDLEKIYSDAAYSLAAELQGYIGLNMKLTKLSKGKLKKASRNPNVGAGTLRLITGNLYRSFTPNKTSLGNVLVVKLSKRGFTANYGSSLPYAAIHEYGRTAGNGAVIPARPYLAPALEEWEKEKLPAFKLKLKLQIIKEMKSWLAKQKPSKK